MQTGKVIGRVSGYVKTQLIAHDKEVHDIAFTRAGGGRDLFASVGSDGSVRMFDLRCAVIQSVGYCNGPMIYHISRYILRIQTFAFFADVPQTFIPTKLISHACMHQKTRIKSTNSFLTVFPRR